MKWVYVFLTPAIAFTAYFIHSLFKYTRMIHGIFLSLVYRPANESFSTSRGEKVSILDSSDQEIETLFIEAKNPKKLIIFCHESGASKESWEKYASFLPSLGCHVLSVDFEVPQGQAQQNSLSQWPALTDVERLLTVVRWAKKAHPAGLPIVLFGISNGADIAFAASFYDTAVAAVVADGLFSMKEIFRDYIRRWAPVLVRPNFFGQRLPEWIVQIFTNASYWYSQKKSGKRFVDVEKLLHKKHIPLLMIHGEVDDYVPQTHQRFLEKINRRGGILDRLIVPGARHNQAVVLARELYEEKIVHFLEAFNGI